MSFRLPPKKTSTFKSSLPPKKTYTENPFQNIFEEETIQKPPKKTYVEKPSQRTYIEKPPKKPSQRTDSEETDYETIPIHKIKKNMFIRYSSTEKPILTKGGFVSFIDPKKRFIVLKSRGQTWCVQLNSPGLKCFVHKQSKSYLQDPTPDDLAHCNPINYKNT